jgi:adenosylhomocysteine nucleosidase
MDNGVGQENRKKSYIQSLATADHARIKKLHWSLRLTSGRDRGRIRAMQAIAVVAALRVEISPLRSLLSAPGPVSRELPIYIGTVEGTRVILVRSGVGKKRALAAAELIHSEFNPSGVLSTGFCGGLVPELKPSDVVCGSWIVCDGGEPNRHSKRLSLGNQADFFQDVLKRKGFRTHVGGFACVSRPVVLPTERSALVHRTGAVVAEMETYHLGEFFHARRIPFVGMRIVVDTVEDSIPLLRTTREARLWPDLLKRLAYLLSGRNAPSRLWRFYQNGRRAQVALRQSVAALIGAWPKTV